jgi:hypothetical protein
MKTYNALLTFEFIPSLFGITMMATPQSSRITYGPQLNYSGILGSCLLISGVLISTVAGILIENVKKRHQ